MFKFRHRRKAQNYRAAGQQSWHKLPTQQRHNGVARKRITFVPNRNQVRFVTVPPRSQNRSFWFTESATVVRKGFSFEVEPEIKVQICNEGRIQLTALAQQSIAVTGGKHDTVHETRKLPRSSLEVLDEMPALGDDVTQHWRCVGSVRPGCMAPLRVILPAGSYQLRCAGVRPVQVFAQVWEVERKLS